MDRDGARQQDHGVRGDYTAPESAYAHSGIARANVARVLTEKVESGYLSEEEAVTLAHRLLRENGPRFLGLGD
jgi:hypothetical protein